MTFRRRAELDDSIKGTARPRPPVGVIRELPTVAGVVWTSAQVFREGGLRCRSVWSAKMRIPEEEFSCGVIERQL